MLEIRIQCLMGKLLAEFSESVAATMNKVRVIIIIIIIVVVVSISTVFGYCFQLRMPSSVRFLQTQYCK